MNGVSTGKSFEGDAMYGISTEGEMRVKVELCSIGETHRRASLQAGRDLLFYRDAIRLRLYTWKT